MFWCDREKETYYNQKFYTVIYISRSETAVEELY